MSRRRYSSCLSLPEAHSYNNRKEERMVNHEVEKKCSLLARFYCDSLESYCHQVREKLPVYLNTAEKIRLKISKGALTLTDRTIWHNKLERVPISLIRECKVDALSPKICYFVNEYIMDKYQVIAVLCKNMDDSHKLVNNLQHYINKGSKRGYSPDPKSKSNTIGTEFAESHSRGSSFRWGRKNSSSLPQHLQPPTINTSHVGNEPIYDSEDDDFSSQGCILSRFPSSRKSSFSRKRSGSEASRKVIQHPQTEDLNSEPAYYNITEQDFISRAEEIQASAAEMQQRPRLETHPKRLSVDLTSNSIQNQPLPAVPMETCKNCSNNQRASSAEPRLRNYTRHQMEILPNFPRVLVTVEDDDDEEHTVVVMRQKRTTPRRQKQQAERRKSEVPRRDSMREAIRSSVIQYNSDTEEETTTEDNKQLQANVNGIANVIIGDSSQTKEDNSTDDHQNSAEEPIRDIRASVGERSSTRTLMAASSEATDSEKMEHEEETVAEKGSNLTEGVYDNITSTEHNKNHNGEVSDLEKLEEELIAESSDDEYELVLTGLEQLTKNCDDILLRSRSQKEKRYPHQIKAAISTQRLNGSSPIPAASSAGNKDDSLPSDKTTSSDVNQSRPRSMIGSPQLIKATEARRSKRMKGQYTSIAEYEKLQQKQNSLERETSTNLQQKYPSKGTAQPERRSLYSSTPVINQTATANNSLRSRTEIQNSTPQVNHRSSVISLASSKAGPIVMIHPDPESASPASRTDGYQLPQRLPTSTPREDNPIINRRVSVVSLSSIPSNVHLKRVSSNLDNVATQFNNSNMSADRRSRSFDRKALNPSNLELYSERESNGALKMIGKQNQNVKLNMSKPIPEQRHQYHSNDSIPVHQQHFTKPMLYDTRTPQHGVAYGRPVQTFPQWSNHGPVMLGRRDSSRGQYVSMPNTAVPSAHFVKPFYNRQHPKMFQEERVHHNSWETNPGFQRFFESIMTYGPSGKTHVAEQHKQTRGTSNQPDIVLESLTSDQTSREDDSDDNSSIRSSASAYWPPELKLQTSGFEEFEEAASWQFHNPVLNGRRKQTVHA